MDLALQRLIYLNAAAMLIKAFTKMNNFYSIYDEQHFYLVKIFNFEGVSLFNNHIVSTLSNTF